MLFIARAKLKKKLSKKVIAENLKGYRGRHESTGSIPGHPLDAWKVRYRRRV